MELINTERINLCISGSKVCYDETENLTKKVREALKKDESLDKDQSAQSTESVPGSETDPSSNTKESDNESVKKRDKV